MKLKVWMVKEGIDRREFAKTLGVAAPTLSRFCSGGLMPSPKNIAKIHNLSGGAVSFADFYNDQLSPPLEVV